MALLYFFKYFAALILLNGVVCYKSAMNLEAFMAHDYLLNTIYEDWLKIISYAYKSGNEVCQQLLGVEINKNETSAETETREQNMINCVGRFVYRVIPTASLPGEDPRDIVLRKYGLDDIRKVMDQKYEHFFEEIIQRMDDFVFGLTPAQQSDTVVQNLKGWLSNIKSAPTLAEKEMTFRKCMEFYKFQRIF